jgi:hypothetical protein
MFSDVSRARNKSPQSPVIHHPNLHMEIHNAHGEHKLHMACIYYLIARTGQPVCEQRASVSGSWVVSPQIGSDDNKFKKDINNAHPLHAERLASQAARM